jgi:tRNA (cmo5U34)-methyltransferase
VAQNHFDPDSYPKEVRLEVPCYDELEDAVAESTDGLAARRILDLGSGTGETAGRVLARHPGARVVLVDSAAAMLEAARSTLDPAIIECALAQRLEDPLPPGPFDLVVSALAVHHVESADKRLLFERVAEVLAPGGRFVLADVIVPEDGAPASTPVESGFDRPDRLDDLLAWMSEAGLGGKIVWERSDLVIISADCSAERGAS